MTGNCVWRKLLIISLVIIVVFFIIGFKETDLKSKYIGMKYLKCPEGLVKNGGWVIENDICVADFSQGKIRMLWLEKTYMNGDKVEYYKVLNVIILPKIGENENVYGGQYDIKINNKLDSRIIAIAEYEDKEYLTKIKYAWKVNMKSKKLEKINTKGIACFNDGYGI